MKINAGLSIANRIAFLALCLGACTNGAHLESSSVKCEELDMQATRLAGEQRLEEAATMYDRAMSQCPADPSRMTSRGVLYALMGQRERAERLIYEAIELAESRGEYCRADLSRAEINVIRGGAQLKTAPKSCRTSER